MNDKIIWITSQSSKQLITHLPIPPSVALALSRRLRGYDARTARAAPLFVPAPPKRRGRPLPHPVAHRREYGDTTPPRARSLYRAPPPHPRAPRSAASPQVRGHEASPHAPRTTHAALLPIRARLAPPHRREYGDMKLPRTPPVPPTPRSSSPSAHLAHDIPRGIAASTGTWYLPARAPRTARAAPLLVPAPPNAAVALCRIP
ncbi:hypothetical protein DFH09DRAFT_1337630 [Mycena vulgaris]|nr:hypothetical protein DFH09DRAFT_1337630 [Mycena vulgaris]